MELSPFSSYLHDYSPSFLFFISSPLDIYQNATVIVLLQRSLFRIIIFFFWHCVSSFGRHRREIRDRVLGGGREKKLLRLLYSRDDEYDNNDNVNDSWRILGRRWTHGQALSERRNTEGPTKPLQ